MGNTENGFNKKRDQYQYGEVNKDKGDDEKHIDLPKPPNKGVQNEEE